MTIIAGDALNKLDLLGAAQGVDIIFHAVSFTYREWEQKHLKCLNLMIEIAEIQQAKLALVDNIYAYGRISIRRLRENSKKEPHTKKGKIRLAMEHTLKDSDVPSLIVHMPDLYGPNAENTILYETLKSVAKNKKANYIGNTQVQREFLYTFDAVFNGRTTVIMWRKI